MAARALGAVALAAGLAVIAPAAARAQASEGSDVLPLLIAELQQDDRDRSWRAAVEILRHFTRHKGASAAQPGLDALARRLEQGTPEQQRAVVKAVGEFFRLPPDPIAVPPEVLEALVPLFKPALKSPSKEVVAEAIRSLGELDRGLPAGRPAIDKLLDAIVDLRQNPFPSVQEVVAVVRVVGARRPTETAELKATVARLVQILKSFTTRGRSEKYKEVVAQVLDEMHALTGWRFPRSKDAIDWWTDNEKRAPLEWYRERLATSEGEVGAAGRAARSWWQKYIRTINGDNERLLGELSASVLAAEIPEIRADAVRELARLAARADLGDERVERAYGVLIQALDPSDQDVERNPEVLKALLEALTQRPPAAPALLERAGQAAARALGQNTDRDVRLLAVRALGVLKATGPQAMEQLYAALRADQRDASIAIGALEALARIGAAGNVTVLRELNAFLQREGARDDDDAQRDPRLVSAALTTLAAVGRRGDLDPAWPEVQKSVELAAGLLRYADRADPTVGPRVRQLAVLALADLKRPEALAVRAAGAAGADARPLIFGALADPDADVARYAIDAVGALAAHASATPADRQAAFDALAQAWAPGRNDILDALLSNLSLVARADLAAGIAPLHGFAQRLADGAKEPADWARLARLVRDLPAEAPEGVDAKRFADLRTWLAEGLLRGPSPDARAALEVLAKLGGREPRHRLLTADALGRGLPEEVERADRIYAELLAEGGDATLLWGRRVALAQQLVERGERALGRELCDRLLKASDLPNGARVEVEAIRVRASAPEGSAAAGEAGRAAGGAAPAPAAPPAPPPPGATPKEGP